MNKNYNAKNKKFESYYNSFYILSDMINLIKGNLVF